jgi:hypothetical protein
MQGFAGLRLVGTSPIGGIEECSFDDAPRPLPFPTCVRDLPRGSRSHDALDALERASFCLEKVRLALATTNADHDGPRAA